LTNTVDAGFFYEPPALAFSVLTFGLSVCQALRFFKPPRAI